MGNKLNLDVKSNLEDMVIKAKIIRERRDVLKEKYNIEKDFQIWSEICNLIDKVNDLINEYHKKLKK
jgi:hypothetical protein